MNQPCHPTDSSYANQIWFEEFRHTSKYQSLNDRPIAYFCAEYGFEDALSIFAGGLGILAGDVVKEAADQKLPMVAVGLYYHRGYVYREDELNLQAYKDLRPDQLGLKQVLNTKNKPLIIKMPIQDKEIFLQAWKKQIGGVSIFLLDTDLELNTPHDRLITDRLYVSDKETRFKQAMVLGIGGLLFLEAIQIHPSIYHINEGHSAMLALELIHHEMKERDLTFDEAKQFARRRIIFTNHTLISAGNEVFSNDLVSLLLARYAEGLGVSVSELVKIGLVQESSVFSLTMMSLRMSGIINAVSKLHAKKAKDIWVDHPMVAISNGIHVPTWDRIKKDSGKLGEFWKIHQTKKRVLLDFIKKQTDKEWSEDHLLIGWARRIVSYKRPMTLFEDIKKFQEISKNTNRPVRVVIAGQSHPDDEEGTRMLKEIMAFSKGELKEVFVYLPNYNIEMAKLLVSGCDVWLNTPIVGFEASGTSGMKAALNGVLPVSTKDGWIDEIEMYGKGWLIDSDHVAADLVQTLEKHIMPFYYKRDVKGIPLQWEQNMRNARQMILNDFSTTRMLREYIQMLYS
ncbi:TPA: hypothetical protein DCW61_01925 [Candidatus Uhrbacteria bacterium]|nr:hypothetical protein [Candidatus Uhrbacteria bacterium]